MFSLKTNTLWEIRADMVPVNHHQSKAAVGWIDFWYKITLAQKSLSTPCMVHLSKFWVPAMVYKIRSLQKTSHSLVQKDKDSVNFTYQKDSVSIRYALWVSYTEYTQVTMALKVRHLPYDLWNICCVNFSLWKQRRRRNSNKTPPCWWGHVASGTGKSLRNRYMILNAY